ncbi:hypothetical protein CEXT_548371 [Caerostris extrusa]|uniref:Uncharacterized protein n=1 Tax=Caerostris extrusa TaxID=172846 RepID=A0AAV4WL82_CAEEX|nr:hypothetical protein CEXT_548371 [Caerostris extrusa]
MELSSPRRVKSTEATGFFPPHCSDEPNCSLVFRDTISPRSDGTGQGFEPKDVKDHKQKTHRQRYFEIMVWLITSLRL